MYVEQRGAGVHFPAPHCVFIRHRSSYAEMERHAPVPLGGGSAGSAFRCSKLETIGPVATDGPVAQMDRATVS
jgi:hypothetical protein